MTRLTDDLRALTGPHLHKGPDTLVQIPIGALRAAIIAMERFDSLPLTDRRSRPEWMFYKVDIRGLKGRGRPRVDAPEVLA